MEVKKEVNSLRSWLRALKARLGAKASKNFQPAKLLNFLFNFIL